MSVSLETKSIETSKGTADGMRLQWESFSLLLIGAPKGFLACCIFDIDMINQFGKPAALVESTPDKPIGTLDNMVTLTLMSVNPEGATLGLRPGMPVMEALELLF
ncbi:DUF1805 domain-containing protein [bacterium]